MALLGPDLGQRVERRFWEEHRRGLSLTVVVCLRVPCPASRRPCARIEAWLAAGEPALSVLRGNQSARGHGRGC